SVGCLIYIDGFNPVSITCIWEIVQKGLCWNHSLTLLFLIQSSPGQILVKLQRLYIAWILRDVPLMETLTDYVDKRRHKLVVKLLQVAVAFRARKRLQRLKHIVPLNPIVQMKQMGMNHFMHHRPDD